MSKVGEFISNDLNIDKDLAEEVISRYFDYMKSVFDNIDVELPEDEFLNSIRTVKIPKFGMINVNNTNRIKRRRLKHERYKDKSS